MEKVRLDKWLWAARFYKTRSLAVEDIHKGRVDVNAQPAKPARDVRVGDMIRMRQRESLREVQVLVLSDVRGGAPAAQLLYAETEASLQARAQAAELRRMGTEPALSLRHGRPGKHDRRAIDQAWGDRWSASVDP
ncbi:MAG: RNA-binding S4 domain-containing protein [Rhodoferax sp.]|jgi:ribosome-associated heat shock protein Hsp15|nr:RNA-binding S4 domain-containing protein [Rhodoferax sp.]